MANVTDRLNQLQQYMNYYRNGGDGTHAFAGPFGNPSYPGFQGRSEAGLQEVSSNTGNPFQANNASLAWAQDQMDKQQNQQNMEDQNSMFKGMYSGNGQSPFGPPPAYVQPNNQQQQPNPYSARAMQLNSGDGGAESNSLAQMFRNGNYKAGG